MVQLARAWRVSPAALFDLDDDNTIATMIAVLEEENADV